MPNLFLGQRRRGRVAAMKRRRLMMRSIRSRALAVTAVVVLLTMSLGAGVAAADGGRDHRNAENTFTKWITDINAGTMAGVVGGAVGDGTYAGQILAFSGTGTAADPVMITADYHFAGARHSFTARVDIVQIGAHASISGVVTDGWLKGNVAEGEYAVISCTHGGTSTDCFQGTLDILRGTKSRD
jgi:hypothetical protein